MNDGDVALRATATEEHLNEQYGALNAANVFETLIKPTTGVVFCTEGESEVKR